MREFCLCVYSFVICWSPLGGFGTSFCPPWGDFAPPFGSLWGALGSQGALLGVTLASLWFPLGAAEPLLGTLGSQGELWCLWVDFGRNWTSNSEPSALKYAACAQKLTSTHSPPAVPDHPQTGPRDAVPHPPSRAGGQDDVSLKQTPSK